MILSASSTVVEWVMVDSDAEWRHCFGDGDMWRNNCSGEEGWMGGLGNAPSFRAASDSSAECRRFQRAPAYLTQPNFSIT